MKRLGMWNRLAVVAFAASSVGFPTYWHYVETEQAITLERSGYEACMANKNYRPYENKTQFEHCWGFWREEFRPPRPTGDSWLANAGATAILSAIVYLLIWGAVATAKWIWRGRKAV